jgi:hypothetical protein
MADTVEVVAPDNNTTTQTLQSLSRSPDSSNWLYDWLIFGTPHVQSALCRIYNKKCSPISTPAHYPDKHNADQPPYLSLLHVQGPSAASKSNPDTYTADEIG